MLRTLAWASVAVVLSLVSHIASAMPNGSGPVKLTAQDSAAIKKWLASAPPRRGTVNLADPVASAGYLATLKRHGITPQTRPYLFETLEKIKARHREQMARGEPIDDETCKNPEQLNKIGNFRTILGATTGSPTASAFTSVGARALDSIYQGASYVLDTLDVYDEAMENNISSTTDEIYASYPNASNTGPNNADPRFLVIDSPASVNNNPTGGPVYIVSSYLYRVGSTTVSPCVETVLQHLVPKSMTMTDPRNIKYGKGAPIVICLNRQNANNDYSDCDYGPFPNNQVGNDDAKVLMVVTGTTEYNDPVSDITQAGNFAFDMTVIPRDIGGGCPLNSIDGDLSHFTPNGNTLSFHWPYASPADFGKLCWQVVANNTAWDFALTTRVKTLNKGGVPTWNVVAAYLSDGPGATPNQSTLVIPTIVMQFGCIRRGQKVLMSDGTEKPIEQLKVGDVVMSNGELLRVQNVTTGNDDVFFSITTDSGAPALVVTANHPVAVKSGTETGQSWVQAQKLKEGQEIYRRTQPFERADQAAKIVKIEKISQSDQVYNLSLAQVNGQPIASETASFYVEGIRVGDNALQNKLGHTKTAPVKPAPLKLVGKEQIDHRNWLSEQRRNKAASTRSAQ